MTRLPISSASGPTITLDGRRILSFGGCNYLGLSHHPDVQAALIRGLREFGISTSASRETTGNTTIHDQLEDALAGFLGTQAAVVVPDGYTANLAAAQALSLNHDIAVIDDRCHRSIREAIAGSGLTLLTYRHLDPADAGAKLDAALRTGRARASIWTDGVFAADGSVAPVPDLLDLSLRAGATLVIDDCHGFCALGPALQGTLSHFRPAVPPHVIITTTLAKGLGCHGGVVAGTSILAETVRTRSTAYICTTPVSPAIAAAAAEAVAVVRRDPDLRRRLHDNAARLRDSLRDAGLSIPDSPAPIFAFTLPTLADMRRLYDDLLASGFFAPLIDYPDGPAPCYFRLSVTSEHTPDQIDGFTDAIRARTLPPARPNTAPTRDPRPPTPIPHTTRG